METDTRADVAALLAQHGYTDWKWLAPGEIVVAQWARLKCMFGCPNYGRNGTCPPNVPSVEECRRFFSEYSTGVVLRFNKAVDHPDDRHAWTRGVNAELLKLEKAIFLAGHPKAFLLFMDSCAFCDDCTGSRAECKHPKRARPSPESMAVDVFSTVRKLGYPIEVLSDYTQAMNRYAFLLID